MLQSAEPQPIESPTSGWLPRGEYMLLDPIELPEQSSGGIFLPTTAYRKTNRGFLIKRGPQCTEDIPAGAEIFFPQNVDFEIEVGQGDHKRKIYIVKESDIILWRDQQD